MYISRIQIQNFRNFRNFDMNLSPNAVVLGENNVGKSNLLFALRLVLDPTLPNSVRKLEAADFFAGIDPFKGNQIRITVSLADFQDNSREHAAVPKCFSDQGSISNISYVFAPREDVDAPPEETTEKDYDWDFRCNNSDIPGSSDASFQKFMPLEFLPVLRNAAGDLETWQRSPLTRIIKRLKLNETYNDELTAIGEEIDGIMKRLLGLEPLGTLENNIRDRLEVMIGRIDRVDPSLGLLPTDAERLLRFLRLFADDGVRLVSEIGTGYANIIYLILLLLELKHLEETEDGVEIRATSILAVEEPEAHLHPHLQRLVFSDLFKRTANNLPIFVTTHSTHIASVSSLNSIILLKRTPEGTIGRNILNSGLEPLEISDIERYLDVTRAELLFSSKVLFVEGIAEAYIIPEFIRELTGKSPDVFGITVVNVDGTDFVPYIKLVSPTSLDLPFAILTDADPLRSDTGIKRGTRLWKLLHDNETELSQGAEMTELAKSGIFVGNHTLEIDLVDAGYEDEFLQVFQELGAGTQRLSNLRNDLNNWNSLDSEQKEKAIPDRIENFCGKGRFAQRLIASHQIKKDKIPPYIRAAISYLGLPIDETISQD